MHQVSPKPSPADGPGQQPEEGPSFCTMDMGGEMKISTMQEVVQMMTTFQCFTPDGEFICNLESAQQPSTSEVSSHTAI